MTSLIEAIDWNSDYERVLVAGACHIFWGILFYAAIKFIHFKGLDFKTAISIKQKFVALTHDILVVVVPLYVYIINGVNFKGTCDPLLHLTLISGAAYFTMHLIVLTSFNITSNSQILHHVLTVVACYAADFVPGFAATGCFYLFSLQLSHIPLHGRSMLREFGLRYTTAYEFFELMYFVVYMFERIVLGMYAYLYAIVELNMNLSMSIVVGGLNLQSVYFSYQMILLSYKKYLKFKERSKKGIHYWFMETNPEVEKLSYYKKEEKEKIF